MPDLSPHDRHLCGFGVMPDLVPEVCDDCEKPGELEEVDRGVGYDIFKDPASPRYVWLCKACKEDYEDSLKPIQHIKKAGMI